jgi:hypothetical protein
MIYFSWAVLKVELLAVLIDCGCTTLSPLYKCPFHNIFMPCCRSDIRKSMTDHLAQQHSTSTKTSCIFKACHANQIIIQCNGMLKYSINNYNIDFSTSDSIDYDIQIMFQGTFSPYSS